jgi:hypothetical protein
MVIFVNIFETGDYRYTVSKFVATASSGLRTSPCLARNLFG